MARILWLNWSGGGNLPPSLGIAAELERRSHRVTFAGRPEMVPRVSRAGFRAIELRRAYEQAGAYPNRWMPRAASFLTSPAVAEEIRALLDAEGPDLVMVDQMFPVALLEAARFGRPSIAVCHTAVRKMLPTWRAFFRTLAEMRAEAGFAPIPSDLESLWMAQTLMIATTPAALDDTPCDLGHADRLHHVGPSLAIEPHAAPISLPWDNEDVPLVLVSFSTMPEQGSVSKFQATIDALAGLPVHAVVTVGDSIDPAALRPAANVLVLATADHGTLMQQSRLVVTHGGHGTLMRALAQGLPLVVVPGMAADQSVNAAAVEAWGVGKALPRDAAAEMIKQAVTDVLAKPGYSARAREVSQHVAGVDGAARAADIVDQLLAGTLAHHTG